MLRTLPLLVALFAAPAFAANQVHTVGQAGVSDFTDLQAAVNAAADGDILLVRYAEYFEVTIDGKGLTLIGLEGPFKPRFHQITIRNLSASQRVTVRGMDTLGALFNLPYLMKIEQCAGAVTIEDCNLDPAGALLFSPISGQPLVDVLASTRVVFSRCAIAAAPTQASVPTSMFFGSVALHVDQSDVAVYDSTLTGARGADASFGFAGIPIQSSIGNAGIDIDSGSLLLAGCTVTGGRGGNGALAFAGCVDPSDGSAGLVQSGGVLRVMDTTFAGGAAGVPGGACQSGAVAGPPMVVTGGSSITINETLRTFEISSPAFEGNAESTLFTGVSGEPVLLLISLGASNTFVPGVQSTLHPAVPFFVITLGFAPPSGQIAFTVALPNPLLPAGIEGIDLFEQCVVPGNSGFGLLSAPSVRTVIQAGL